MVDRVVATIALMRHGGSHLIRPIVAQMGFDIVEPGNFGAPLDEAQGPVIVFLRDPRDRMVSTLRWWREKPRKLTELTVKCKGKSDDEQLLYLLSEDGFLEEMLTWARIWCNWPNALIIRFEDIRYQGCSVIDTIADHLGFVGDTEAIFNAVYEKSHTFTGRYSNWYEWFGVKSNSYWELNGGIELLELMGYK